MSNDLTVEVLQAKVREHISRVSASLDKDAALLSVGVRPQQTAERLELCNEVLERTEKRTWQCRLTLGRLAGALMDPPTSTLLAENEEAKSLRISVPEEWGEGHSHRRHYCDYCLRGDLPVSQCPLCGTRQYCGPICALKDFDSHRSICHAARKTRNTKPIL